MRNAHLYIRKYSTKLQEINLQYIFRYIRKFPFVHSCVCIAVPEKKRQRGATKPHRISTANVSTAAVGSLSGILRRKNYQRTEQNGGSRCASWFCVVGANGRDKAPCEALVKHQGGPRRCILYEKIAREGIAKFSRPQKLVNVRGNCGICRNDKALRRRTTAPFEKALFFPEG